MIPDQDGLSVLRGGLTTLFKVAYFFTAGDAQNILEAFEVIPTTLIDAIQSSQRFPDAFDLRDAVAQLCYTVTENLGKLIQALLRSHPDKHRGKLTFPSAPRLTVSNNGLSMTLKGLLKLLDVPECAAADTLASISRCFKLNAGSKSKHLMRMERFQDWLAALPRDSDLVLIDGHYRTAAAAANKVSLMSAICASLFEELQRSSSGGNG
ncbi:hypothetical protein B0T26DRAFT_749113 [Lasiosphaeria miniovina]|uniref:Uncharacterized protein n=1 Tax=Lasiosphaeria miniovina TaxID=1954250 RepID=A0AA40E2A3_9PEZI|nr:uncharacterized protein B0T26DRAFT_749113 [Lasiosphaeria miniovina]KAK0721611.1 hypothetical protein B0T26DRAFT_749113 [Lasiosphaeria miniovina]